jgi:glycosyltransferase involved in cell wall biosynthesis
MLPDSQELNEAAVAPARSAEIVQIGMGWFSEEPGGLNRMCAGLWQALGERGACVRGLVAGDAHAAPGAPANVRFFARREASLAWRFAACRRALRRELGGGADVVAAHFAPYALPALDLLRGKNFVFHFHGPWAAESLAERQRGMSVRAKRLIESTVYSRAERIIVLSRAFGDLLADSYGVPAERIHVVPGGVDARRFAVAESRGAARAELGLPDGRPIVGVVRRLVRRMGLEGLIAAFAAVRDEVPDALLAVAGTGPLARELAALVDATGLGDHVRLVGFVAEERLPLLYRACDLTVVPSIALEGFGLTTIESLAAGTPVLVTPIGGLPEAVMGLDRALVLPGASPAAIAQGISDALTGALRLPSSARCSAYARAEFDWSVIASRVMEVYG